MIYLRYLGYLLKHKYHVWCQGRKLGLARWRMLIHDWSKFSPSEYGPWSRRHANGRGGVMDMRKDPDEFHRAWVHHREHSPHHWEHWLRTDAEGRERPDDIPETYIREMVADWRGASLARNRGLDVRPWYLEHRDQMKLSPKTRARVEELIEL